jgi:2-polyprenyl-6-methoxyphenol hydroxylase-like FAD-dependent oxidoreductase
LKIIIIGGGIGGLTAAIALQKSGFCVTVYESAPVLKPAGAGLVLAANAIRALKEIGIGEDILKAGKLLRYLYLYTDKGKLVVKTDSLNISRQYHSEDNFTIHRADLHNVLLSKLAPGTVILSKRCIDFSREGKNVTVKFDDGGFDKAELIIAADGINSGFRKKLIPGSLPRYSGYTGWRGITEKIPAGFDDISAWEIWGSAGRFGIVPLNKNRIYWFCCVNEPFPGSRASGYTPKRLLDIFGDYHGPVAEIIKSTDEDKIRWDDIMDIKPLRKFAFGNVLLLGDAAHATTPNMGQGACMAIEDSVFLSACLKKYDMPEALKKYESLRLKRTKKIIDTSRMLGYIGQFQNPFLISLRNWFIKNTARMYMKKNIGFLYDIKFNV